MSASEMERLKAENARLGEDVGNWKQMHRLADDAAEAASERADDAEAAQSQALEALREAREHMIGRALCDDTCETLRMVDRALSGSSAPQAAATPDALRGALRAIIIRCTEGDPRTNWLPIIANIARAALSMKSEREDAEGGSQKGEP